jgi:hypothetical protein
MAFRWVFVIQGSGFDVLMIVTATVMLIFMVLVVTITSIFVSVPVATARAVIRTSGPLHFRTVVALMSSHAPNLHGEAINLIFQFLDALHQPYAHEKSISVPCTHGSPESGVLAVSRSAHSTFAGLAPHSPHGRGPLEPPALKAFRSFSSGPPHGSSRHVPFAFPTGSLSIHHESGAAPSLHADTGSSSLTGPLLYSFAHFRPGRAGWTLCLPAFTTSLWPLAFTSGTPWSPPITLAVLGRTHLRCGRIVGHLSGFFRDRRVSGLFGSDFTVGLCDWCQTCQSAGHQNQNEFSIFYCFHLLLLFLFVQRTTRPDFIDISKAFQPVITHTKDSFYSDVIQGSNIAVVS